MLVSSPSTSVSYSSASTPSRWMSMIASGACFTYSSTVLRERLYASASWGRKESWEYSTVMPLASRLCFSASPTS